MDQNGSPETFVLLRSGRASKGDYQGRTGGSATEKHRLIVIPFAWDLQSAGEPGGDSFCIASRRREKQIPRYARDDRVVLEIEFKLSRCR